MSADTTRPDPRVRALIERSNRGQWLGNGPDHTLGFNLDACTWPERSIYDATTTLNIWRNPDQSNGDLWHQPARFGTILEWQPRKAAWQPIEFLRQLRQFGFDMDAARTPLKVPWGPGWRGAGGTTDNGLIITMLDGEEFEILGLAPLSQFDVWAINGRTLSDVAKIGDYRVDSIQHRRNDTKPVSAQGPMWRSDGILRPEHLEQLMPGELRLSIFNSQWGPQATAAPGGWVEHKGKAQPFGLPQVKTPTGGHPDMVPCWQPYRLDITDLEIEQWIRAENTPPELVPSRRWFARNLRGYTLDTDRPAVLKPRIRACVSGTGNRIFEATGWSVPTERAKWAARGVISEKVARELGRNILLHGRLEAM